MGHIKKSFLYMLVCGIAIAVTTSVTMRSYVQYVQAVNYDTTTVIYPYYAFIEDPDHPWGSVYDALDETGTIGYSDEFFSEPSPGDHPQLRAMSYALALAGYENQADGYPASESVPYPKLTSLLDQLGFSDYQSWDISSEANGHSMGTTIGHKTLPSGQELIVVAPRNYNYMTEWLSNFNVGTNGDHAGFTESANLILGRLDQYLASRDLVNYKIWMVGYSRGGAVVDLVAKSISENIDNYNMTLDDFYAYTFGAPRASTEETKYTNIHDVKDGNDLLLGYVFPELWGFYNTGTYEEIHPADLGITTSVIDITDLADSSRAINLLSSNDGLTVEVGTMNGKDFMDAWIEFITANGLTREYFDSAVKPPLSALMQAYQLRTIDKQSEFLDFIKDTNRGMLGMVAANAFADLMTGGYGETMEEALANFPPYQDLTKILKGTATDADVDDFLSYLTDYIGEYEDYEARMGITPSVTETEFATIKDSVPRLIKALSPFIIADAAYTRETYGENYSLFYTYTLVSRAENLVIGHIPESIMPILKSLILADIDDSSANDNVAVEADIPIPNTGTLTHEDESEAEYIIPVELIVVTLISSLIAIFYLIQNRKRSK